MAVFAAPNVQHETHPPHPTGDDYTPERVTRIEGKVDNIVSAVFGNPLDAEDHGMLGEMRETRRVVSSKLDRLYYAGVSICGTMLVAAVTIAVALH